MLLPWRLIWPIVCSKLRCIMTNGMSSGKNGPISKKGERYLRMLLTNGARAILRAAELALRAGKPLDGLRTWATEIQARAHHNKATCALANKLARVCYAALRDLTPYGNP